MKVVLERAKKMIQVYDRNSKECYVEKEFGKGLLEFLYGNPVGRIILKTFIINKFYSKIKDIICLLLIMIMKQR